VGDPLALHHSDYHAHLYHLALDSGAIKGWRIEQVLGRGGYGAVASARHLPSGRVGALKLTHPDICQKEVDILRRFGGESIPRLLDGPFDLPELGYPASSYVMELADETLAQHFDGYPIRAVPQVRSCSIADKGFYRQLYAWIPYERRERDALAVASAVLAALEAASSHVHGDVCPSNILLFSSGTSSLQAKLADWGNARAYLHGTVDYTLIGRASAKLGGFGVCAGGGCGCGV
jgi:serine/threonine protein kinase